MSVLHNLVLPRPSLLICGRKSKSCISALWCSFSAPWGRCSRLRFWYTAQYKMPHSIHDSPPKGDEEEREDVPQRYWNINMPSWQWTDECPGFLRGISEKDRMILSTRDEMYHYQTWDEAEEYISEFSFSSFSRRKVCERSFGGPRVE
jgi:hypothetical protein